MNRLFDNLNIANILSQLIIENDNNRRKALENKFLVSFYIPATVIGAILGLVLMPYNNIPSSTVYPFTGFLLFVAFAYSVTLRLPISEDTKHLIINLIMSLLLITNFFIYYDVVGPAYWLFILLIAIPSILNTRFTTCIIMIISAVIMLVLLYFKNGFNLMNMNSIHYKSFILMYITCFMILFLIKVIFRQSVQHQQKQFSDLVMHKNELDSLYQNKVASEEKLKATNDQLNTYSKLIEKKNIDLNFYANFDPLTRLPNRKHIYDLLDNACESDDGHSIFAFACLDLDDFKTLNDSLGHEIGDELLTEISKAIKTILHPDDILGRIGGDEFAVIISSRQTKVDIQLYLNTILDAIKQEFRVKNYEISPTASAGVSIYPIDATKTTELISNADAAMYRSKQNGHNSLAFFDEKIRRQILNRIKREELLMQAIISEELYVVYQPIVDAATSRVISLEALVRWNSNEIGVVPPPVIIETAEHLGMISDITNYVLIQACINLNEFISEYGEDVYISVNLSPSQFVDEYLVSNIIGILNEFNIKTKHIVLEITELVFTHNTEIALSMLKRFRNLGIRIAIDDFGTGYSSLEYLLCYPSDILKIDKTFIDVITPEANARDKAFAQAVIALAHNLNMTVVAEGVENRHQAEYLTDKGCDVLQGYYFYKPQKPNILCKNYTTTT